MIVLLILLSILFTGSMADYSGWYVAKYHKDSFRPTPFARTKPIFLRYNTTHAILYGGYLERISNALGRNVFYNDMYWMDATDPNSIRWTKINYLNDTGDYPLPSPRGYECGVVSSKLNALFLYGGLTYPGVRIENVQLNRGEVWKFHFSNYTWELLSSISPAGPRAGHQCVLDKDGDNAIVAQGIPDNQTAFNNFGIDMWKWNLASNTWTNLTDDMSEVHPVGRWLYSLHRLPSTNTFVFLHGKRIKNEYMKDVWTFNSDTKTWINLTVSNQPEPKELSAYALTSKKWLLMMGGDADGLTTMNDSCPAPLSPCFAIVNPTDDNFFLRLHQIENQNRVEWDTDEGKFDHLTTPHRHGVMIKMYPHLYFYGGHDWDGKHGIGEIYNTHLWGIKLDSKFWEPVSNDNYQ